MSTDPDPRNDIAAALALQDSDQQSADTNHRRFAFLGRFADETLEFGTGPRVIDQLFPTLVVHLRKFPQFVQNGPSFCITQLGQFVYYLGCAHYSTIRAETGLGKRGRTLCVLVIRLFVICYWLLGADAADTAAATEKRNADR